MSQVQDIHKVAFWTGPIRQSERQHIPRIHFTGVSVPILALQLTAGLEFCTTSSQGSCYDRVRAREGHFMAVKKRYMKFPLPKISACLRVVKSSVYTPHTSIIKPLELLWHPRRSIQLYSLKWHPIMGLPCFI